MDREEKIHKLAGLAVCPSCRRGVSVLGEWCDTKDGWRCFSCVRSRRRSGKPFQIGQHSIAGIEKRWRFDPQSLTLPPSISLVQLAEDADVSVDRLRDAARQGGGKRKVWWTEKEGELILDVLRSYGLFVD